MNKILLIEDNPVLLKTVDFILKNSNYNVVLACNGKEAIEAIDREEFDLVITDLMLPYANGMEILEKVKREQKQVPVLIISAVKSEETIIESFEMGANDYIKKPFTPGELLSRVKSLLTTSKQL